MMSSFSLSPSVAISPFYNMGRSNRPKGRIRNSTTNFAYFAIAVFSLALALAYQHGEIQTNYARKSSPFIGTAPVSASVATTSLSLRSSRVSSPTSVSMTAGSSRTLIELINPESNEESGEYHVEVTFLDEDVEHGLLVLRRANTAETGQHDSTKAVIEKSHAVYQRAVQLFKNPIVAVVAAGNIASVIGILPAGIAGFLPAVAILLRRRIKWALPVLKKLGSLQPLALKTVLSKIKMKSGKVLSSVYKNRSRYSLLGDCLWFVDTKDDKNKGKNNDGGARSSKTIA